VQRGRHDTTPGERHHLTVLFTDLCDSTQLGQKIEPEEFQQLVRTLHDLVDEESRRRGGLMVRGQGDGTVAVFGYPQTAEDDAVRAVEVALAVRDRLQGLVGLDNPLTSNLALRSGIHSGMCFVSDGDLRLGVLDLQGNMVNTTAQVQKLADPGGIRASQAALGPHENLFELKPVPLERDLADHEKAPTRRKLPVTLELVEVLGRRGVERRFDATSQRGLTPFIGRNRDVGFLLQVLAPDGPRCVVVQSGAGLGKTRLLEEFVGRADLRDWQVLRGHCESFGSAEVLQPFMQMSRASGLPLEGLMRQLAGDSGAGPALMIIDDWQWADDASRQLLATLLERRHGPRVILAARTREDGADWIADASHLTLQPFSVAETQAAVRRWMPAADPFLARRIHEYAGGVPLFIEELCHSASDRLWESLDGRGPVQTWLTTLVASRLDRLTRAQPAQAAMVRAAAVIGNVVPVPLLRAVCDAPLDGQQLRQLAAADFLYADERADTLRFKHGITRDAVYEAIGLYERKSLHSRVEEVLLASGAPERVEDLEALAYHAQGAGRWERAAQFADRAGDRALGAHATDRARAQYQAVLQALERLPQSRELTLQWCAVAAKLGLTCIFDTLSLGENVRIFEQAVARARELGDTNVVARAYYWLAYIRYGLGDFRTGIRHARRAIELARESGDGRLAAQVEATLGQILAAASEYDEALALMNDALSAKREQSRRGGGIAIGSAYTLACKGSILADRGEFDAAQVCFDEALDLLGASMHPVGTSARNWITISFIWQGRWQEALRVGAEGSRIAENTRSLLTLAVSRTATGFARWCSGDREGLEQMRDAIRWMDARDVHFYTSLFNGWLCEASVAEGDMAQARHAAAVVLWRARQGERLGEAMAARAIALAAARQGKGATAARWMRRADASAALRGSPREQALNEVRHAEIAALVRTPA
jgi:tetratricopeptide (TPR) repeat protein